MACDPSGSQWHPNITWVDPRRARSDTPDIWDAICAKSASRMHIHYIHLIGRSAKSMNPKNTKKSPIHENADTNITCDFGDGDISRLGVANQPHVYIHRYLDYIKIIIKGWECHTVSLDQIKA